nr:RnfABCDGE type electron transport complex subunit D [Marinicella sp. W31]MDC2879429.1 RnfABCDGE type electron transport complex subunit D [Marinicella sp. W31]
MNDDHAAETLLTEEAALVPAAGEELRVVPLVEVDALVAQGEPLLSLRAAPDIRLVAPMAARVAAIELNPGRRLIQMLLFREDSGDRHTFTVADAEGDATALRALMQAAGLWRLFRSRPFGHMPAPADLPAAIFVMATDSRPDAPDPMTALSGREDALSRGLAALNLLAEGAVFLCEASGVALNLDNSARVRRITCGSLHPQGLAGIQIHHHAPAEIDARVWDIHAEDVADLGDLLASGLLPETRLVTVTGSAMRAPRLLRCQPGADLRGLCHGHVQPGPYQVLAGSVLDGRPAHWLGHRDRQASIVTPGSGKRRRHWFSAALTRAARPLPIIPTAALAQSFGGDIPAAALMRALSSGDQEAAARLGALSLLEEDLALVDYVTSSEPSLAAQLRGLLNAIEKRRPRHEPRIVGSRNGSPSPFDLGDAAGADVALVWRARCRRCSGAGADHFRSVASDLHAGARSQPSFAGALTALAVAMLAPEDLSIVQLVLGISFGSVMAELVFGGWGRNVLNPATVTLAFLGFGFVTAPWPELPLPLAWAAIPAALLGAFFGVMPARVIAGAVIVIGGAHLVGVPVEPALPAIAVVLVLLVADPVASASTKLGGWLNGAFFGALIILFTLGWQTAASVQLAVSAALLTSLAAPLLDEAAIALWLAQRRRRHG